MKNEYICDFGDCRIELPSEEMFYVKMPKNVYNAKIKRFCSKDHMIRSAQQEGYKAFEVI